jgi:Ca-activated chloride channel homolog
VLELAQNAKGQDEEGYRAEFIRLVNSRVLLSDRR